MAADHPPPKKFLAVEGGDAVGKSTTCRGVYERLVEANVPVALVHYKHPSFAQEHVAKFMGAFETVMRGPRHLLTDEHWVHMTAAWYHVIDRHSVRPALQRGELVIADSWLHKPLTRFRLQDSRLFELAKRCFEKLEQPNLVCVLDLEPELAAARKSSFGFGETGNFEARQDMNRENFIIYQRRYRQAMRAFAEEEGWPVFANAAGSAETAEQIVSLLKEKGWI